jgi:hypothetical protein
MTKAIMTFEIGHLTLQPAEFTPSAPAVAHPAAAVPAAVLDRAVVVDHSDVIPASPPPEVLAEVDAAWENAKSLAEQNRELHFARDKASGRVIIEVRTLDGEVLKTIPPSKALEVVCDGVL